jgi:hypothetical protein
VRQSPARGEQDVGLANASDERRKRQGMHNHRSSLYHRVYELTFLIQGWLHSERRRPGSATSRFQASQQASTMAR